MANIFADYLTASCAATGKSTFYNTEDQQTKALETIHSRMAADNRRLYTLSAALPINDRSKQLILNNLLSTGKECTDGHLETQAMRMVVEDMQFNRVLNLMVELRAAKVNNSRTRRLGRMIWEMTDEYRAIKYASKLRTILRHCHIGEGDRPDRAEMHQFIYGANTKRGRAALTADDIKHCPKIKARLLAPTKYESCFELPYDIAVAIAVAHHGKTADDFKKEFVGTETKQAKGQATRKEQMRSRQTTGATTIDFNRFSIFELYMHAYRNEKDRNDVLEIIVKKASRIAENLGLPDEVALVIDNSVSALGSAERLFQPISMIASIAAIINNAGSKVHTFYVGPKPTNGYIMPEGATNLRRPLVEALMVNPKIVFILSDGYENTRAGSVAQILATKAYKNSGIPVMHLNPVAAVEAGIGTRSLAENVLTFAISQPEQLPMITLLGLASQGQQLLEPMFAEIEQHIKNGDFRAARLATRVASLPALA